MVHGLNFQISTKSSRFWFVGVKIIIRKYYNIDSRSLLLCLYNVTGCGLYIYSFSQFSQELWAGGGYPGPSEDWNISILWELTGNAESRAPTSYSIRGSQGRTRELSFNKHSWGFSRQLTLRKEHWLRVTSKDQITSKRQSQHEKLCAEYWKWP